MDSDADTTYAQNDPYLAFIEDASNIGRHGHVLCEIYKVQARRKDAGIDCIPISRPPHYMSPYYTHLGTISFTALYVVNCRYGSKGNSPTC